MSSANGYATRDSLFGKQPSRRFTELTIEGYGKWRIRSLNANEANEHENAKWGKDGKINREAVNNADCRLIVLCVVDGDGNPVFTKDDVSKLMEFEAAFVNALALACVKHNGGLVVTVEDAEKNFEATPA